MLKLSREQGQTIYLGERLCQHDLERTFDYRIDCDEVDHRIGSRRVEVTLIDRFDIQKRTLTEAEPDWDFAPGCRLALLKTYEYLKGEASRSIASLGLRAPRQFKIIRDDANPVEGTVQ